LEDNYLPDINNLKESDIIGEWNVVSISHTDGPGLRIVRPNEIFIFSIRDNHQFILDFNPFFTYRFDWELIYANTNHGFEPAITTSLGSHFFVREIKQFEMKLLHGTIEYLLSKTE
jgi:hypothetical protein